MKPTYTILLNAALRAAFLVLATKLLAVVVIANLDGATVELRTLATVIPYLAVTSGPTAFLAISTYSTLAMALSAALYLVPTVIRPGFPSQSVWGRLVGVVIAAETLTLQVAIHYLGMANIRTDRVWWVVMALLVGLLLTAAGLGFSLRAPVADPEPAASPEGVRAPRVADPAYS